jgi:hydroxymethylbilane synthase
MAQSGHVARDLEGATGLKSELVPIRVEGDDHTLAMDGASRPGIFASALRDALLAGEVDYVVHSFKDLPSAGVEGLVIPAIPARQPPFDVLAGTSLTFDQLPPGARIGTSSPRRASALLRCRSDLQILPVRGNVDTRLRKVTAGELDAVIMAYAGLERLGVRDEAWQVFSPEELLPAPAQGALAVECRQDSAYMGALGELDHLWTRLAVTSERSVLAGVGATCTTAVAALATWEARTLTLTAELSDHLHVCHALAIGTCVIPDVTDEAIPAVTDLGSRVAEVLLNHEGRND